MTTFKFGQNFQFNIMSYMTLDGANTLAQNTAWSRHGTMRKLLSFWDFKENSHFSKIR